MAAPQSNTNKGKSELGLRPELVEAKERIYIQERQLSGPHAEAHEAAIAIEERMSERKGAHAKAQSRPADELRNAEVLNDPDNLGNQ